MLTHRMLWRVIVGAATVIFLVAIIMNSGGTQVAPTTPTAPTTSIPEDLPEDDRGVEVPPSLAAQARGFLQSYYLVNPDDTEASRRKRVSEYVAPAFLPKLPVQINLDPGANQARQQQDLSMRGEVIMDLMSGSAGPNPQAIVITVPVVTTVSTPDGRSVSANRIDTATVWSNKFTKGNREGRWLLQSVGG